MATCSCYGPVGGPGAVAGQQPGSEARWQSKQRGNGSRLILNPALCLSFLCRSVVVDDRNRVAAYDLLADTKIRLKASSSDFLLVSSHFLFPLVILVLDEVKKDICLPMFTFCKVTCEIMYVRWLTRLALYTPQSAEAHLSVSKTNRSLPWLARFLPAFLCFISVLLSLLQVNFSGNIFW